MRTVNIHLTNEVTSDLSSINKTNSIPLITRTKYPFPYYAGIFGIAAKRYKPAMAVNMVETLNDPAITILSF
jgi:hypothetical protein